MGKKRKQFNPVFENLQSMLKRFKKKPQGEPPPEPPLPTRKKEVPAPENDEVYFQSAMEGVKPLSDQNKKSVSIPSKDLRPPYPAPDDSTEGMLHLRRLVEGNLEMDISFTDEYIEGAVPGLSPKIMRTLKRGKFPIQGDLDLHGLTQQEAELKIRDFLIRSHRQGLRCVLVVHGRGLNSPDSFPVLKERIPVWLNRGPARKIVLAFATARSYDGGTGAIYVLLRTR